MKKFFTLIAAVMLGVLSMNAADYKLSLTTLGSGWSSSYDADTKTITFDADWVGRGWWFDSAGQDFSAYDKVVVEFAEEVPMMVKLVAQYAENAGADLESDEAYASVGATRVELALTSEKKPIMQIYIQAAAAGKVVLKDAYLSNESGEVADLNLSLSNLGAGWSSAYDADTKTITYDAGDWGGRGWWFSSEGQDLSDYNTVIIETEPLTVGVKIVVEYAAGADMENENTVALVGATTIKLVLDSEKKPVKQIYLQINGNEGGTVTLKKAYVTVTSDTDGINAASIAPAENGNAAIYNLAGQQVGKAYKGVVIKNGKKYIQR